MKKQLLLGSALLAAISAFPQASQTRLTPGTVNMAAKWAEKYERLTNLTEPASAPSSIKSDVTPTSPVFARSSSAAPIVWNAISASMNVYGVLVSNSKPLQYNNELKAISFIHRKSPTYQPNPFPTPLGAETGAIVGMVSTDMGNTWDSTLVWNDNNNWARYPQGGLYNSSLTNTNIANAYIVATGPVTQANTSLGWIGNFFASKSLATFDNVASTTPNAQQFISSQGPTFGATGKVDFARLDFTSTDDGKVRTVGGIYDNANGTTAATQNIKGARVVTGSFNSGVFTWSGDSIPLNVITDTQSGDRQWLGGRFNMAWNDAGNVGYVWYYGCKVGATGNNTGYQPIVYKTSNSGLSWTNISSINFNDKATFKKPVLDHLFPVFNDTSLIIPFFNFQEGFDGTVDKNDELHIMATLWSSNRAHPDSLGYAYTNFVNWDGETYAYAHGSTNLAPYDSTMRMNRPYIYDFYTSGSTWKVAVIDSMSSEAPGESSTADGYGDNPWDNAGDGGTKVSSDARLQMSRTPGGSKLIYTWAESDTGYTNQGRKWNHVGNLHARLMDVNPSFGVPAYSVHKAEYNLTNPSNTTPNPFVKDRAQMHNTSPRCAVTATAANGYTVVLPIKVTNNQNTPMKQLEPNQHWYSSAPMEFTVAVETNTVGLSEAQGLVMNSVIYPNPSADNVTLMINLTDVTKVNITVMNIAGQVVSTSVATGSEGVNHIPVHVKDLPEGVYMVKVNVGNVTTTKKLILE